MLEPRQNQETKSVTTDFTTHGGSHLYGLPYPSADSLDPMDHFCTFYVSRIIPKNMHYLLYVNFKHILAYIRGYDPQTRVHRDVCKRPNSFGVFLDVDLSHLSLGLPYALRYRIWPSITPLKHYIRSPFDTLKGEELKSRKTIVHCCQSLYLSLHPFVPWSTLCSSQAYPLLVSLLSRDGGLKWWRTQFLRFADVSTEVVTIVISDLY